VVFLGFFLACEDEAGAINQARLAGAHERKNTPAPFPDGTLILRFSVKSFQILYTDMLLFSQVSTV